MAAEKTRGPQGLIKLYLLAYNFGQVIGWSHVFYETIRYYVNGQQGSLWEAVNPSLFIFQTGAILEVVNAALGFVNSSVFTTFPQVGSRILVLWCVLYWCPPSRESFGLPLLLFAWCVTEIVRYSFYGMGILNCIPHALVWCRYTFFYALYPIGVTGELATILKSFPYVRKEKPLSLLLPNAYNWEFLWEQALYAVFVMYVLFFPQLYKHMISQRKKILGSGAQDSTKSSGSKKVN